MRLLHCYKILINHDRDRSLRELATIAKIAEALQIPVYSLFYEEGSEEGLFLKMQQKEKLE